MPHTRIAWEHLPQELGFGSGMICWRRLAEWIGAGVWPRLHEVLLAKLRRANALDFATQGERPGLLPGGRRRLPHPSAKGGSTTGRSPVDRGRTGGKHHLITDATGIPLAATLTGGNRNDVTQLIPLLQAVPPVRGKRGRPRRRPDAVLGDRGYDHDKYRRLVWVLGVKPLIARRGTEHGSGLGTQRGVVERAFAHLSSAGVGSRTTVCDADAPAATYSETFRSPALRPRSVQSPYRASSGLATIHSPGRWSSACTSLSARSGRLGRLRRSRDRIRVRTDAGLPT